MSYNNNLNHFNFRPKLPYCLIFLTCFLGQVNLFGNCGCPSSGLVNPLVSTDVNIAQNVPINDLYGSALDFDIINNIGSSLSAILSSSEPTTLSLSSTNSGIVASNDITSYSFSSDVALEELNFALSGLDYFDQIEILIFLNGVQLPVSMIDIAINSNANCGLAVNGNTVASTVDGVINDPQCSPSVEYSIETAVDSIVLVAGKAADTQDTDVDFVISDVCFCTADDLFVSNCDELICNGDLQVSLNQACELLLTYDDLLEAPEIGQYDIEVLDEYGNFLRDDFLLAEDVGKTLGYRISCDGNSCWGSITIEANSLPQFEFPCAATDDGIVPPECRILCQPNGAVIGAFVTADEVRAAFTGCGPQIIGDIQVFEKKLGDFCDPGGEVVEVSYSFKVLLHDRIQTVELPAQRLTTIKLAVDDDTIIFPEDVILDCDYLDDLEIPEDEDPSDYPFGSPESIGLAIGIPQTAYITYEDILDTVYNLVQVIDTVQVLIGKEQRDTMILERIGDEELWVLKTIAVPVYEEQIIKSIDTIGIRNDIVPIVNGACNVLVEYSDVNYLACDGGTKILRTWSAINWCNLELNTGKLQTIEIGDFEPPKAFKLVDGEMVPISMLDDKIVGIDPWSCSATVKLPELTIYDNCNTEDSYIDWDTEEGSIADGYLTDLWLSDGPHKITGYVTDPCGNQSTVSFNLYVTDKVAPVAICQSGLTIALASRDGVNITKVFAADLNEGSHDSGCGPVEVMAIRKDDIQERIRDCEGNILGYRGVSCYPNIQSIEIEGSEDKNDCNYKEDITYEVAVPGDYVKFCCDDLGKLIPVIIFVTDKRGNVSRCEVEVFVTENVVPSINCGDVTLVNLADEDLLSPTVNQNLCESEVSYELELLQESTGSFACPGDIKTKEWYLDLDNSGDFSVGDPFCVQTFRIDEGLEFDPYEVKWPLHYDSEIQIGINLECDDEDEIITVTSHSVSMNDAFSCGIGEVDDEPYWCPADCGLIGVNYEIDTIRSSDACLKLIKRWTIVDWCIFDSNNSNEDQDEFIAVEDWTINECYDCAYENYSNSYFKYKQVDIDGYYTFNQIIKVLDDARPTINADEEMIVIIAGDNDKTSFESCIGSGTINASATDFCGDSEIGGNDLKWIVSTYQDDELIAEQTLNGAEVSIETEPGKIGEEHNIVWRVIDLCGNSTTSQSIVKFQDQIAPTPFCITGITTAFYNEDSKATIWANEFDFGSFDECTSTTDLIWTIVPAGEEPLSPDHEDFEDQQSITFDCNEDQTVQELDAYIWDESGNSGFCRVSIILDSDQDCGENTGSSNIIAGGLTTIDGRLISDAEVQLMSSVSQEYPKIVDSDQSGSFAFANNPFGNNYQLSARKSDSYINGISTLDIVIASRHIIGLDVMDNPFKIIAGDVNGDQKLSAADLAEVRRLVLGKSNAFNMPTWLFVKMEQTFFDNAIPWPYVETIDIIDFQGGLSDQNMVGIKMGDLNQNVSLDELNKSDNRYNETEPIIINNSIVVKGDIHRIPFYSSNIDQLYGIQFALDLPNLEFVNIESGVIDITKENIAVNDGDLLLSWHNPYSIDVAEDDVLFYLSVKANEGGELNDLLSISSESLAAELYSSSSFEISTPFLNYIDKPSNDLVLHQNYPNPFIGSTTIEIQIPEDVIQPKFSIHNIQGGLIYKQDQELKAGLNMLVIPSEILTNKGAFFYSIRTESEVITKQMLSLGTSR